MLPFLLFVMLFGITLSAPPTTCPCAGWQDCVGGRCVRKPNCDYYANANDMGDNTHHDQWHRDHLYRGYCSILGGKDQGQCNDVDGSKYNRCFEGGFLFCNGQWITRPNPLCSNAPPVTTTQTATTTTDTTVTTSITITSPTVTTLTSTTSMTATSTTSSTTHTITTATTLTVTTISATTVSQTTTTKTTISTTTLTTITITSTTISTLLSTQPATTKIQTTINNGGSAATIGASTILDIFSSIPTSPISTPNDVTDPNLSNSSNAIGDNGDTSTDKGKGKATASPSKEGTPTNDVSTLGKKKKTGATNTLPSSSTWHGNTAANSKDSDDDKSQSQAAIVVSVMVVVILALVVIVVVLYRKKQKTLVGRDGISNPLYDDMNTAVSNPVFGTGYVGASGMSNPTYDTTAPDEGVTIQLYSILRIFILCFMWE
eukprot:m.33945 g.33945  ORF g.33945 m.33945 type:complete len:431 (+) comp8639_c0_seq1:371-1663(+)